MAKLDQMDQAFRESIAYLREVLEQTEQWVQEGPDSTITTALSPLAVFATVYILAKQLGSLPRDCFMQGPDSPEAQALVAVMRTAREGVAWLAQACPALGIASNEMGSVGVQN